METYTNISLHPLRGDRVSGQGEDEGTILRVSDLITVEWDFYGILEHEAQEIKFVSRPDLDGVWPIGPEPQSGIDDVVMGRMVREDTMGLLDS